MFRIIEPIRGVRIYREKDLWELPADCLYKVIVLPRFDLQFYPLISASEFLLDPAYQGLRTFANAQRNAAVNLLFRASEKTREGKSGELGLRVPKGIFDA